MNPVQEHISSGFIDFRARQPDLHWRDEWRTAKPEDAVPPVQMERRVKQEIKVTSATPLPRRTYQSFNRAEPETHYKPARV
jgi:hypothetical protein